MLNSLASSHDQTMIVDRAFDENSNACRFGPTLAMTLQSEGDGPAEQDQVMMTRIAALGAPDAL